MDKSKIWMLFCLFTLIILGCGGEASVNPAPLPGGQTDAGNATRACVPGQQIACPCLGGIQGVQACHADGSGYNECQCPDSEDAGTDAVNDATPAKKSCAWTKDVPLTAVTNPIITSAASLDGFAVGSCEMQDAMSGQCALTILGKNEGPVYMAQIPYGMFGFQVFGAPHGYLVAYTGMTDAGEKAFTAYVDNQGALSLERMADTLGAFAMAPAENGGYWFNEDSWGELKPQGNASMANIRYMSPQGTAGNPITLSYSTQPVPCQNQIRSLATLGKTVAASASAAADDGTVVTAAFLVQPDSSIVKVVLDKYYCAYSGTEVHSSPGTIVSVGNRFAMQWSMMSDPYWKYMVTYMDKDGSSLETIELPSSQYLTWVGDAWAGVENDQINLKITLRLHDERLQPISEPIVVAQGMKTYYMSSPVARSASSDEIAVVYLRQTPEYQYEPRLSFVKCL